MEITTEIHHITGSDKRNKEIKVFFVEGKHESDIAKP